MVFKWLETRKWAFLPNRKGSQPFGLDTDIMVWRELIGGVPVDGGRFTIPNPKKGFPDIAGVAMGGRLFAIELKLPGETAKPHQEEWLTWLTGFGVKAAVAHSLDDVALFFQELRNEIHGVA